MRVIAWTFILLFSLTDTMLSAQTQDSCIHRLPVEHIEIRERMDIGGGSKDYALCSGATAKVVSGMHRFYLQQGAVLEVVGGSPQVYAQAGASVIAIGGTPRIDYSDPAVLENEGRYGVSVTHLCEVVFLTDDTTSCLYTPPVLLDTLPEIPAVDTLAVMAELMMDSTILSGKRRTGSAKNGEGDGRTDERVKIPNSVAILHSDTAMNTLKTPLLITRGTASVNGDRNKLFVQPSSVVTLNGEMNTAYLLKGSSIHIEGSQENTIYFESGALVTIEGEGRAFRLIECRSIAFD